MENAHDITVQVMQKLAQGRVRMHSRMYFFMRLVGAIVLSVVILLLSAYVLSFIAFSVHESGEGFLLGFGGAGILTFLALFPWVGLALDIACIVCLEWLLQSFRMGYRYSFATLFAALVLGSALIALGISATPLQPMLLDQAEHGALPSPIGEAYEGIRGSHQDQGIFRGTVQSMQGREMVIVHNDGDHDEDDGERTVALPYAASSTFHIGDRVYVFGSQGPVVQAYGAHVLSPDQ